VVTFAIIIGRSNPPGMTLTKCGLWGDMADVITYAIFDCRLRGMSFVRGVTLPCPIDLRCRPYNTGHTTLWTCDTVAEGQGTAHNFNCLPR